MAKATAQDIQDLLDRIRTPSVDALILREEWIAQLKHYAEHPEELEDNAARFALENARRALNL